MKEVVYSYYKLEIMLNAMGIDREIKFPELDFLTLSNSEINGYVKPNFKIIEGDNPNNKKPKVLLISATGATGKSALANMLSFTCKVPVFDLAKHPPVAARAITGLIFDEFDDKDASLFRDNLINGRSTLVIDALDEGRIKVKENTFNAFLDDIVSISKKSTGTPFILLGRNSVLEHTYLYFLENNIETTLMQIEPFTKEQAKEFIDNKVIGDKFQSEYRAVRDYIVNSLESFFENTASIKSEEKSGEYKRFIGYAPVLSAISTLLKEERNYNKLLTELKETEPKGIDLIISIIDYILLREKEEKSDLLVIDELMTKYGEQNITQLNKKNAYKFTEQSYRLIQKELKKSNITYKVFDNGQIDGEYNERINNWLDEHPFRLDGSFQNIVFESYAVAQLMNDSQHEKIALEYLNSSYKSSYLLFLLFDRLCESKELNHKFIYHLNNSLKEIETPKIKTNLIIETEENEGLINGEVDFVINFQDKPDYYSYHVMMDINADINLGRKLGSVIIYHPGSITLHSLLNDGFL